MDRRLYLLSLLCLVFIGWGILAGCSGSRPFGNTNDPAGNEVALTQKLLSYQDTITPASLRKDLKVIAADSMEGRETGTRGQLRAARYLVSQYRDMGLEAIDEDHNYLQPVQLKAARLDSLVFHFYGTGADSGWTHTTRSNAESIGDVATLFGNETPIDGSIVFAGFGVSDTLQGVDPYAGLDVKDQWVMVFENIPHVVNGDTLVAADRDARWRLRNLLFERGAAGVLVVPAVQPASFDMSADDAIWNYRKLSSYRLDYLPQEEPFDQTYAYLRPQRAVQLLGLQSMADLVQLRDSLASRLQNYHARKLNAGLKRVVYDQVVQLSSPNVAAFLPGRDPQLSDQVVVLSAHYDHLGIGRPDSTGDQIYNGADDDGSGTVALLSIARTLVKASENGDGPRRSVLFLHVTGEEKGLLGSRFYSDHPLWPLKQTITDFNIDMIGRVDQRHREKDVARYSYVIGGDLISSELSQLVQAANTRSGKISLDPYYNDLDDPNQFYRRSDHWNFARHKIPFVFFFTGVHEDYHQPSDEVTKIRFDKMSDIVRTIYASTVLTANAEKAPQIDNQVFLDIVNASETTE